MHDCMGMKKLANLIYCIGQIWSRRLVMVKYCRSPTIERQRVGYENSGSSYVNNSCGVLTGLECNKYARIRISAACSD